MAINTYWEPVTITLPNLKRRGVWHLSVDTYGNGEGQYVYPVGKEPRIDGSYMMNPQNRGGIYGTGVLKTSGGVLQ